MASFVLTITDPYKNKDYVFNDTNSKLTIRSLRLDKTRNAKAPSMVNFEISDPNAEINNALPDPATRDIPVRLEIETLGNGNLTTTFTGIIKTKSFKELPRPEILTIVAHDKSRVLRKGKKERSFHNISAVELCNKLAVENGLLVDFDNSIRIHPRSTIQQYSDMTDWDIVTMAIHAEGLDVYVENDTLFIRRLSKKHYHTPFRIGTSPIDQMQYNSEAPIHNNNVTKGMFQISDTPAQQGTQESKELQGTTGTTSRLPLAAPKAGTKDAHHYDVGPPMSAFAFKKSHEKDTLDISFSAFLGDYSLDHIATIENSKNIYCNGDWFTESISFDVLRKRTTIKLKRKISAPALKKAGLFQVP